MSIYKKRIEKRAKYRELAQDLRFYYTKHHPNDEEEKITFETI